MEKARLMQCIAERYSAEAEYPWMNFPHYAVFRHLDNQKWFAVLMEIPKSKLGLAGGERIEVLNVKCDPLLIGSLREEKGIYPAYHMSKASWITVALDGAVADDQIKWLLDMSYELTRRKRRKKKASDSPA